MNGTLLYIGNFKAPTSTENTYAYAFEQHGWQVIKIEQADAYRLGRDHILEAVAAHAPSLVLYTRSHNATALTPRWTDLWRALEDRGVKTASIHLDVFWGIPEREQWIADGDPLFSTGTVFTADGRVASERAFFEAGVHHQWLPPAIDERNLLPRDTRFEPCEGLPPIVWVGSSRYHVEWPWREELVNFLRKEYGNRLIEYGHGSPQGVCRDNATITTLYASDTIVIGDSMFAGYGTHYWSDRVPETMGRGGFLLHPVLPSEMFHTGYEYAPLDPCDLISLRCEVSRWSEDDRRLSYKRAARHLVARRDTYTHRAASILAHLGLTEQVSA